MDNNLSFKSRIKFIPYEQYEKLYERKANLTYGMKEFKDTFCTNDVATCSAGGLINQDKEILGFHFHNLDFEREKLLKLVESASENFEAVRGLLVGSKDLGGIGYACSLDQFMFLKNILGRKVKNLSLLQEHKNRFQTTSLHYDAETDTWLVTTMNAIKKKGPNLDFDVHNVEDAESLKDFYKKIYIADGDQLFIGDKEITRQTNPEFFSPSEKISAKNPVEIVKESITEDRYSE